MFNIHKFYVLPTQCIYVFCGVSEQTAIISLYRIDGSFLGAFAKLRKTTISFVMSVRPSYRMEQLGSHWTDFHEI